jgi:hypothetical protein
MSDGRVSDDHDRDPDLIGSEVRVDCPTPATSITEAADFWRALQPSHITTGTQPGGG